MSHPSVVFLDSRSVPRRVMAGESVCEVPLPVGSRVVYPRPPQGALRDPLASIRRAFDEPMATEPLSARLTHGMRLVVAVEALYHGSPASLYWLGKVLREVLLLANQRGASKVTVLLATGVHRRLFDDEKRALLHHCPLPPNASVLECDPEGPHPPREVLDVDGHPLSVHPEAAEADLVVTLSVAASPEGGGYSALVLGLGGFANARAATCGGRGALATLGALLESKVPVFAVELVLDSKHTNPQHDFLAMNEDDLTSAQRVQLKGFSHLPKPAALRLASDATVSAGLLGVFCGSTPLVHAAAQQRLLEQHLVPLSHPADVLVTGLPAFGPHNTRAALNPVLVKHLLQSWVLGQYAGRPALKPGGTVVLLHPCTNRFDHQQHTAHFNFFNSVLPTAQTLEELNAAEARFVRDPALLAAFRTGHAYHPGHPFLLWKQACEVNTFLGRVIVVGADNESVPQLLGYETAASVAEALYHARNGLSQAQDILCLHNPLTVVCQLPEAS